MTEAFGMVEKALKEIIEREYDPAQGKVGGDLSYERGDGLYVYIDLVSGQTDRIFGEWAVDIDVFGDNYAIAMQNALELEAILLEPMLLRATGMSLDFSTQNESPTERPWEDESVYRIGSTYSFTARRSG